MSRFWLLFLVSFLGYGQEVDITISSKEITIDKFISIQIRIANKAERPNISFPNIEGFTKENNEAVSNLVNINGKRAMVHTLSQKYKPQSAGVFKLPSSSFVIDGKSFAFPAGTIVVTDPEKDKLDKIKTTFINFKPKVKLEFKVKIKPYLIFEAIPFEVIYSISESQINNIQFLDNTNEQIATMIENIKSENVIFKESPIAEIKGVPTLINNEKFLSYTLVTGKIFSNKAELLKIPNLNIETKKLTFTAEGPNGKQKIEPILSVSTPVILPIRSLPKYPIEQVYVGQLNLKENIKSGKFETAKALNWEIIFDGNGLIDLLALPNLKNDNLFDFYNIKTSTKEYSKTLSLQALPKKQGKVNLKNYLFVYYFNTDKNTFDTLKIDKDLEFVGQSISTATTASETKKVSIFDGLKDQKSELSFTNYSKLIKQILNIAFPILILAFLLIVLWKRN